MQNSILQWLSSKLLERTLQPRELLTARKIVYLVLIIILFTASFFWRQSMVDARAVELAIRQDSRGDVELSGELIRLSLTGSRGIATCVLWVQAIDKQKKNQWNEMEILVRALTKLQPHFITPWLFQSWNLSYNVSVESDRIHDKYFYITRGIDLLAEGERQNQYHPDLRFSVGFYLQHKIMQSDQSNVLRSMFQLSMIPPSERDPDRFLKHTEDGSEVIDWVEFEKFITKYPQLARRLHSGQLRDTERENRNQFTCRDPQEVIRFLRDNWRVPGMYVEPEKRPGVPVEPNDKILPPETRFPSLPPNRPNPWKATGDSFTDLDSSMALDDTVDGYTIARAWYGYAQEPLPPAGPQPGSNQEMTDRVRQRRPRHMTTLLFRAYPALTASMGAERQEQEGWFRPDAEEEKKAEAEKRTPEEFWKFPEESWFKERGNKFADGKTTARLVLQNSAHADKTWDLAHRTLARHGEANHLMFEDPKLEAQMYQDALVYCKKAGFEVGTQKPPPQDGENLTGEAKKQFDAASYLFEYRFYRNLSNYVHHLYRAKIESERTTIAARKLFHQADTAYFRGNLVEARETYEKPGAIAAWRDEVLLGGVRDKEGRLLPKVGSNPIEHRIYREDQVVQETAFEIQLRYMKFFTEQYGVQMQKALAMKVGTMRLGAMTLPAGAGAEYALHWMIPVIIEKEYTPPPIRRIYADMKGPFDIYAFDVDDKEQYLAELGIIGLAPSPLANGPLLAVTTAGAWSKPLIITSTMNLVRERQGLTPPKKAPEAEPMPKNP